MFHRRGEFHVQQYVVLYDVIIGLVIIIKSAGQDWQSRGSCVFSKYLILLASYYLIKFFLWIFIYFSVTINSLLFILIMECAADK